MNQNQNQSETERSNIVRDLLEDVLPLMGISADMVITEVGDTITADISGKETAKLTDGTGKALNALQCIANVAANRNNDAWTRVIVDADGYRELRRESLEDGARRAADAAAAGAKEIVMEPMNAFERRIVHCVLADRSDVNTDSRGEDPYRCVVIIPA